jgi:hypothetical protein
MSGESSSSTDCESKGNSTEMIKSVSILLVEIITENKADKSKKDAPLGKLIS